MDWIWSPWRFHYVSQASAHGCPLCDALGKPDDESLILYRGRENFIILNLFPYTSGHLMIAPLSHIAELSEVGKDASDEMMDLAKWSQRILRETYHPHGFNLGMNLGRAAGAGIADHFHLHVLPRWFGDTNFTTVISESRVIPEDLRTSYSKLRVQFSAARP
ncbi:MAG: HIT domain-containing protein [Acidobacteria bacterium]|nr:HIT domain-containing protein [Acidobacteriota bacterium]